jgi:hypothetical protein
LIFSREYPKIHLGEYMAKPAGTLALDSRWTKASELHRLHEQSNLNPLELSRLKPIFPNGLPRGSLIEIVGPQSSGKTSISLYILAESISKGETCACIDLNGAFHPASLALTTLSLNQLCWIRCNGNTEHAMRSADLLLHSGGFGVVLLDLCGATSQTLNRIPLSYWFRFQRAIEHTPTILLICGEHQQARSCSRHSLAMKARKFHWKGQRPFALLTALESTAQPTRSSSSKVTSIRPESLLIQTGLIQTGIA